MIVTADAVTARGAASAGSAKPAPSLLASPPLKPPREHGSRPATPFTLTLYLYFLLVPQWNLSVPPSYRTTSAALLYMRHSALPSPLPLYLHVIPMYPRA